MSGLCPDCGGDNIAEFEDGSNGYCYDCANVIEPIDPSDDLDAWECFNCQTGNLGADDDCQLCGLSREASDYLSDQA